MVVRRKNTKAISPSSHTLSLPLPTHHSFKVGVKPSKREENVGTIPKRGKDSKEHDNDKEREKNEENNEREENKDKNNFLHNVHKIVHSNY